MKIVNIKDIEFELDNKIPTLIASKNTLYTRNGDRVLVHPNPKKEFVEDLKRRNQIKVID